MDTRVRSSTEQVLTLLKFMETHGDLARPTGLKGRVRADRLWAELTNILNNVGGGVSKTEDKWKKVWADWKSKTKKKALSLRHRTSGNGGGPTSQTLTAVDERVLAIMGPSSQHPFIDPLAVEVSIEEHEFNRPQSSAPSRSPSPAAEEFIMEIKIEPSEDLPSPPQPSTSYSPIPPVPHVLAPPSTQERPGTPAPSSIPVRPATPPRARRVPGLPQSTGLPRRYRVFPRRRRLPTPYERASSEFAALELRRLELEETRARQEHERELRALEIENDRNQIYRSIINLAQSWFDYFRSRENR